MKKRIFNLLQLLLLWSIGAFAQATLSIANFDIGPGETKEVAIDLTNAEENICSCGFTIALPEGLSFEMVYDDNEAYIGGTTRSKKVNIEGEFKGDNLTYALYAYMPKLAPFTGYDGALFLFTVKADESITPGTHVLSLKDIELNTPNFDVYEQDTFDATVTYYKDCALTTSVNDAKMGSVSVTGTAIAEGTYRSGSELTVEAVAAEGYHFVKWSVEDASNPYTFTIEDNTNLTATFAPNMYAVKFMDGDAELSSSDQEYGSVIVLPETPVKEGHTFVGWYIGEEKVGETTTVPIGGATCDAKFTVNSYKLTYKIGEETLETSEVEYASPITALVAPEKEGYSFAGWEGLPETMPAKDVTVTGSYTINTYTLIFKIGDVEISKETVKYNSAITVPEAPAKEGYTFDGWANVPETMPASDLTIEGSYTINSYKLAYVIGDVTVSSADVEYGTAVTAIEAPAKEGYTFDGWEGVPETMPAKDVTVTGSYTINTYTLIFKIGDVEISKETVKYNSAITAPEAPAKEGYTFAGWDNMPETMPASDLTIEGSYTINSYKLAYVIGDVTVSSADVEYGNAVTAIEAPAKEGYTFDGWEGVPETMPAKDVTVTGSYTINTYTLIFKIGDVEISKETVKYNSVITAPEAPAKEGYTFAGWANMPETMPASDLTIEGSYTINSYKLAYVIGDVTVSSANVEYGTAVTAIEAPAKEGYTFDGWVGVPETMPAKDVTVTGSYTINTYKLTFKIGDDVISEATVDYNSAITAPEAPAKEGFVFLGWEGVPETMPAKDLVIVGSYTAELHKLTYIIDGRVIDESEVRYGTEITPLEAPVKEGYTFTGWTGVPATMPAADVTVTGSYVINTYKLVFKIDDEVISESIVEYNSPIEAPEAPEKVGYVFLGWDEYPETMPASDLTVNGSYLGVSCKLTYMIGNKIIFETEVSYGAKITPIAAPEREGCTFVRWEGLPETMPAEDVVVKGIYVYNCYHLTFKLDGKVVADQYLDYTTPIVAPAVPEKEGYTFSGWENLPETMPAGDLVVNGYYEINVYEINYYVNGELYCTEKVEYGATIVPVADPEEGGSVFSGWSEIPATMPAHDVDVYGSFTSAIITLLNDTDTEHLTIYTINGRLIAKDAAPDVLYNLANGYYIINGKKILVKH